MMMMTQEQHQEQQHQEQQQDEDEEHIECTNLLEHPLLSDLSASSSGKVRLPPRYVAAAERAEVRMACPSLDPSAIRAAFEVWDRERHGRVSAGDLVAYARGRLQPPYGSWEESAQKMVEEAVSRTGFARCLDEPRVTVQDVRWATSCRLQLGTGELLSRPHREVWIQLAQSALGDMPLFLSLEPSASMYAPPIMTEREREAAVMAKKVKKKKNSSSTSSLLTPSIFAGVMVSRPSTAGQTCSVMTASTSYLPRPGTAAASFSTEGKVRSRPQTRRKRADGRLGQLATFDPHVDLARRLSRRMLREKPTAEHDFFYVPPSETDEAVVTGGNGPLEAVRLHTDLEECSFADQRTHVDLLPEDGVVREIAPSPVKKKKSRAKTAPSGTRLADWVDFYGPRDLNFTNTSVFKGRAQTAHPDGQGARGRREKGGALFGSIHLAESAMAVKRRVNTEGKSSSAFYELNEQKPYVHTTRASDPAGLDRRSRLVRADMHKKRRQPPFILHDAGDRSKTQPLTPPSKVDLICHEKPAVDYVDLLKRGAAKYETGAAPHPYVKNDDYQP